MKNGKLKKVASALSKASKLHKRQSKIIKKHIDDMKSPAKKYASDAQRKAIWASKNEKSSPAKGKLKPCQKAAARKKFDVYPSAYANMWASNHKC